MESGQHRKVELFVNPSHWSVSVRQGSVGKDAPTFLPSIAMHVTEILDTLSATGLKDTKGDPAMEVAPREKLKLCLDKLGVLLSEKLDTLSFVLPKFRITKPKRFGLKEEGDAKTFHILFGSLIVSWLEDTQLGVQFRPNAHFLTALSTVLLDAKRYGSSDRYLSCNSIATTIMFSIAHAHCDSPPVPTVAIAIAIVLSSLNFFPQLLGAFEDGLQGEGKEITVAEK